jgi:hypothetical protein
MKNSAADKFTDALILDLRIYLALCEEILSLAGWEHQALSGQNDYQPLEFYQKRKNLLPNLESLLLKLRDRRMAWQRIPTSECERGQELKSLFQNIQSLLMKVLLLDQENQLALLRRGLVPAGHLPNAARQQPHYVANLYRRHAVA